MSCLSASEDVERSGVTALPNFRSYPVFMSTHEEALYQVFVQYLYLYTFTLQNDDLKLQSTMASLQFLAQNAFLEQNISSSYLLAQTAKVVS